MRRPTGAHRLVARDDDPEEEEAEGSLELGVVIGRAGGTIQVDRLRRGYPSQVNEVAEMQIPAHELAFRNHTNYAPINFFSACSFVSFSFARSTAIPTTGGNA